MISGRQSEEEHAPPSPSTLSTTGVYRYAYPPRPNSASGPAAAPVPHPRSHAHWPHLEVVTVTAVPPSSSDADRTSEDVDDCLPSPTQSETEALENAQRSPKERVVRLLDPRIRFRRDNIVKTILLTIVLAAAILFAVENKTIVEALRPAGVWLRSNPYGFVIPAAILFVLSFPPLLGHEIVAMLVGMFYGLGVGFAIAVVGQFLGECVSFMLFKYVWGHRFRKLQEKHISYAAFSRVVQDGGFIILLISRYTIVPHHITTAIYASAGISFPRFALAALLSTPKIFLNVLIGFTLAFELQLAPHGGPSSHIISIAVLAVAAVVTLGAMEFIRRRTSRVVPAVVEERRKARGRQRALEAQQRETEDCATSNDDEALGVPSRSTLSTLLLKGDPQFKQDELELV